MRVNGRSLTALCAASLLLSIANLAPAADDLRLVEAVKNRDMPAVRTLLAQKVDVNGKWPDGATALHWAAHWGDLDTVKLLLGVGATVNVANDHDVTPLSLACTNGNAAIVDVLLKAGANPNVASPITGETPLMTAARTGSLDVIRLLLDRGADVNAKEAHQGQTAAMWAAAEGHLAAVRVLIERGADVRARSKAGYTPFLFAARTGDVELMRFLLSAGAKVNEEAADGTTALLVATVRRHTTLAGFLLEQGADPNKGPGLPRSIGRRAAGLITITSPTTSHGRRTSGVRSKGCAGRQSTNLQNCSSTTAQIQTLELKGNPPPSLRQVDDHGDRCTGSVERVVEYWQAQRRFSLPPGPAMRQPCDSW